MSDFIKKKTSVMIGIPAYNAEGNIKRIAEALLKQLQIYTRIQKILVYSDAGTDSTVEVIRKMKNKKLIGIKGRVRMGYAHAVRKIMESCQTDVLLLFNDDILISDEWLVEKMAAPFIKEENVGMVSGNPQPLKPKNFIEKAIVSSFNAYERMRIKIRNGHNIYTCDGKILALSKSLISEIKFPQSYQTVGNVDVFLYFSCLRAKLRYRHVPNAKVHYKCPATLKDYISWSSRNNANQFLLEKKFGKMVSEEYKKPRLIFWGSLLGEFFKNPLGSLWIYLLGFYIKFKARSAEKWFTQTWNVVQSTKI